MLKFEIHFGISKLQVLPVTEHCRFNNKLSISISQIKAYKGCIFMDYDLTFRSHIWCCSAATSPEESSFTTALREQTEELELF